MITIKTKGLSRYLGEEIVISRAGVMFTGKLGKDDDGKVFVTTKEESREINYYPQNNDRVFLQGRLYDYVE